MKRMMTYIGLMPVAMAAVAFGQSINDDKQMEEIFEVMPGEILWEDVEFPLIPRFPTSFRMPAAVNEMKNVRDLGAPSDGEIETSNQRAAEKYGNIKPGPLRVGFARPIREAEQAFAGDNIVATELEDGQTMWTMVIRSQDAFGMRLHLGNFDIGDSEMIVYADDPSGVLVRGPYTGKGPEHDGDFWTQNLSSDEVIIEVIGTQTPVFDVLEVTHFDVDLYAGDGGECDGGPIGCHGDAMCDSGIASIRNAVGKMNYMSGGDSFVCTGTLLNDNDPDSSVPWFLTAAHCVNSQGEVNSMEVIWEFQRSSCGGTIPDEDDLDSSVGGDLFEWSPTGSGNDMSFIRLNFAPPGLPLAGWSTDGGDGKGVHHPCGSWKRVTSLSGVGVCPGCAACMDTFDYDFYDMDSGALQGGSSGSGIFNGSGQLLGQLRGRCCFDPGCDPEEMTCSDVDDFVAGYGEFEETYPEIVTYLRLGGTIWIESGVFPPHLGTSGAPYPTISQAHGVAWNHMTFRIRAGSYDESLTLTKDLTLRAIGGMVTIGQ